jgi:hypothetical protein
MPPVMLKTGIADDEGREETLTAYVCDWPDCPNMAEFVLGAVRELGATSAVCREHAAQLNGQSE